MFNKVNDFLSQPITIIIIILLSFFVFFANIVPLISLHEENQHLEDQLTNLYNEQLLLEETIQLLDDEQTHQQMIREQYQLSEEGEILFVIPEEEEEDEEIESRNFKKK